MVLSYEYCTFAGRCAYGEGKREVCLKIGERKQCDKTADGRPRMCQCAVLKDGTLEMTMSEQVNKLFKF